MISHPFHIFAPFPDLKIGIFGKESLHTSDEACATELGFDTCSKLYQAHGNVIHVVDDHSLNVETQGDGLITDQKNHALSVRWADCHGLVIYASEKNVIGALHAGWRGMAAKAITAFYAKLKKEFDVDPQETFVGISPSICIKCMEFTNGIEQLPEHFYPFLQNDHLDLQAAADAELESLGIPTDQIERHPECTCCGKMLSSSSESQRGVEKPSNFWSWRGEKQEEKRNYLIVGMVG